MRRVLVVLVLVVAFALVPEAPVAAAKGSPGKGTPSITYVWGQRVSATQVDVVARVLNGTATYGVTMQFVFRDPSGGTLSICGGNSRLFSGAGSKEWSSGAVRDMIPEGATSLTVTATLYAKGGATLDVKTGTAAIPDVGATMQIWPASS